MTAPSRLAGPPSSTADPAPAAWWPMAIAADVRESAPAPLSVRLHGTPWALAVMDGRIRALKDLCPHRRVPLSVGQVTAGESGEMLQCGYHGWAFAADGLCVAIPALGDGRVPRGMGGTPVLHVVERDGLVWASEGEPATFDGLGDEETTLLPPAVVPAPAAACRRQLTGSPRHADGFAPIATDQPIRFALRPITDVTTELFAVVPSAQYLPARNAWLELLDELSSAHP